ncbi:MAG: DUF1048 domain-containing protein [Enterococcus sp.]
MNFIDKITGNDLTRQQKEFDQRAAKLPSDYQKSWAKLYPKLIGYGDFTGRNLSPILADLLELFEQGAAQGKTVDELIGPDFDEFVANVANAQGAKNQRDKWRAQLNQNVAKKLGK